jgi:hypothetical protein
MPVGWERGVWLPLPLGTEPQVLRGRIGEVETVERRAERATMVVNDCILKEVGLVLVRIDY